MDLSLIFGYILAFFIGVVINLLGGGGSILSIPVLIYIIGIDPYTATSYSLFLVGVSSWLATFNNVKNKLILYRQGLIFAVPTLLVTFIIRKFILPVIPEILFKSNNFSLTKETAIILFFVIVMLITAIYSIKGKKPTSDELPNNFNYNKIITQGIYIGIITGFIGAGGGFLIIPALAFLIHIPMKNAIATSLFIMSITASIGFLSDFGEVEADWSFLLIFAGIMMLGVLSSNKIKSKISNDTLRNIFGYFILILALLIILLEFT